MARSSSFNFEYLLVVAVLFLIPGIYIIEVYIILPLLYDKWSFWYTFHFVASLFFLHNIAGNFFLGLMGPGYVSERSAPDASWKECADCGSPSPPRSWHCQTCKRCILKRDHHCHFFGCCVGYYNFRYFYMFVAHVLISCLYAFVVNIVYFVRFVGFGNFNLMFMMNFVMPFVSMMTNLNSNNMLVSLLGLNVVLIGFTGVLFVYHGRCLITGRTPGELKHDQYHCYDLGLGENLVNCFGRRWYVTWLSPFLKSDMPGDGTKWSTNVDFKTD